MEESKKTRPPSPAEWEKIKLKIAAVRAEGETLGTAQVAQEDANASAERIARIEAWEKQKRSEAARKAAKTRK